MSDQKTERLINLTMALLATKRYLSKSEIFSQVAGYEGSAETKERMFERDKDDLRTLGIEIQVGTHDPLFDDEPGYRIPESDYRFDLGEISPEELSYLSLAATLWKNQLFSSQGAHALVKIDSHNELSPREDFGTSLLSLEEDSPLFPDLWTAITEKRTISFGYRSRNVGERRVAPYGLTMWRGAWYLVGNDLDKNDIRVFKISRINSNIASSTKKSVYEIPDDFEIRDHLLMLRPEPLIDFVARVRIGKCQSLRGQKEAESIDGEWDRIHFSLGSDWMEKLLWFGPDLLLESPAEKVAELLSRLEVKQ